MSVADAAGRDDAGTTWLFDLGNSRLKSARVQAGVEGGIGETDAVAHDGHAFAPGWESHLPARCDAAWIASVAAPGLRDALAAALASRGARVQLARTQAAFAGLRIAYADPARLGIDRFLALLAAHARDPGAAWLVVGVGTALTIDLLDAGAHAGGRIAPSPALMRAALHARVPALPATGGTYAAFAADTDDALASGCEGAALGLIAQSLDVATARAGRVPALLLHGGGADALLPHLPGAMHAPALVLEGLAHYARATA